MEFKKTKGSYVIWAFYTICVWAITSLGNMYLCIEKKMSDISTIICLVLTLSVIAVSYFGIRIVADRFYDMLYLNQKRSDLFEKIVVTIVLILGIGHRIALITNDAYMTVTTYYDMAKVGATLHVPEDMSVIENFYIYLLGMIFTFLGNKLIVGLVFQCILFLIGTAFLYMAVKTIGGKIPAIFCLCGVCFLPEFITKSTNCTPAMFHYFVFGISLWGIALYLKKRSEDDIFRVKDLTSVILPSIAVGVLSYFDLGSIVLLIPFAFAAFVEKEPSENKLGKIAVQFPVALVSGIISFLLCMGLETLLSGHSFMVTISRWLNNTISSARDISFFGDIFDRMVCDSPFLYTLLFTALIWLCIGFYMDKKFEKISVWFLVGVFAFGLGYLNLSVYYDSILLVCVFMLAGSGVQSIAIGLDDLADVSYDNIPIEIKHALDEAEQQKPTYNTMLLEPEKETPQPEKKVNYIPNPLPTPKPHVKKTMGYAFEPEAKDMKYDVHVSDNDDFDLKV